jgi:hypothetical protein
VDPLLDPRVKAGQTSPFAGQVMRECTPCDEKPNPTPIVIGLDVTASNGSAAIASHAKLPGMWGALLRMGIEDPELMIAAIGDANCDRYPLQVGQFEADNKVDDMLAAVNLEMGGGGQDHETYELLMYYLAHHTFLQGRRGVVFLIGDEMPYPKVDRAHVRKYIGDELEADVPTEQVVVDLQRQYDVYFLFQQQSSHRYMQDDILKTWRKLLGENVLVLEDPTNVCEFISMLHGARAGADLDGLVDDLDGTGLDRAALSAAGKALALVGAGGAVATVEGGELDIADSAGAPRL